MNELELGVEQPMRMLIDNQATVVQTGSVASSAKAKHVDVRLVTMRDFTAKEIIAPKNVVSDGS
ncbi:hypothetical protein PF011_g5376 [Phytophthora fragariae]|nr:hypothetical protein PF011_g5376 [Phytophthora fragariae]